MAAKPTTATLLTADDLLAMPDDGYRYELVEGELVQLPMSGFESSDVAGGILTALRVFVYPRKLGRVVGADGAYILARDPHTVRIPDVSFVRTDRLPPREDRRRFLELAPDLAVEVVSPSDSANAVHEKVLEYLGAGVQLVWVVHPIQRTVTVYSKGLVAHVLGDGDTLDGGDLLPGLTSTVTDIFE
ncbi:MAG: Uma2 family endonuclease [Chloroflexota bacterium]|nr:Uma2 family endonuclease [Chloroflexota bacterium]